VLQQEQPSPAQDPVAFDAPFLTMGLSAPIGCPLVACGCRNVYARHPLLL
jgi:hypothetical protein